MQVHHTLILGGRRSGKSRFAERLVTDSALEAVYVATAEAGDEEMAQRIAEHRARRGAAWRTVEEPLGLADAIAAHAGDGRCVLVDCLTLWLANLMQAGRDIAAATAAMIAALEDAGGPIVFVSNEVGGGIVPMDPLARRYADAQGILNQQVAACVDRVVLMAAGIPLQIKPSTPIKVAQ